MGSSLPLRALFLGLAAALCVVPGSSRAEDLRPAGACAGMRLDGSYGFSDQGSIPSADLGLSPGPFVTAGSITFDKAGGFRSKQVASFNGRLQPDVPFCGTYTLEPDCTLTLMDPRGFIDHGVVISREEILLMTYNEGVAITFRLKRITGW